ARGPNRFAAAALKAAKSVDRSDETTRVGPNTVTTRSADPWYCDHIPGVNSPLSTRSRLNDRKALTASRTVRSFSDRVWFARHPDGSLRNSANSARAFV